MKNRLAIYFSLLAMMFVATSCFDNDDDGVVNPYAYIKSFSIGDIQSSYPGFTLAGEDTTVVKTISGSSCKFTIDQLAGKIYNRDSLLFSTDVAKIVMNMDVEGLASMYVEESGAYEYFSADDSIDFTSPRKFRITSLDGTYSKDYTISVNVHQVEPELMVWNKVAGAMDIALEKAIEFNETMCVFGKTDNTPVLITSTLGANPSWSNVQYVAGLPSAVDFTTMHVFNGQLYVLADGDLYTSADAVDWQSVSQGNELLTIIGASDADGRMWIADSENIFYTVDGQNLEKSELLPQGFPLYGVSTSSYALSHHKGFVRYMLVGYTTSEKDGEPKVWSRLSNEDAWVEYEKANNPYPCPALENLTVLRYDNYLYAIGGKGVVGENEVEAFASLYISKDNGIVWKAPSGFYQLLPKELNGKDVPFVAAVDSDNYIWIISSDHTVGVWRGIINRLGF